MKAVVYEGIREVGVHDVADAEIEEPTDVVVRLTSSAICGTDLHMYDGRTGAEPGLVIGHEPLGVVEQAGDAVSVVKPGDRVVIPTHLFCGLCFNCRRGYTAACLRVRPGSFGAGAPWATLFDKGISVGFGRTHDRRYTTMLRDLVVAGRARPSAVVTNHGTLEDAPNLFKNFDRRADGIVKAVLRPN